MVITLWLVIEAIDRIRNAGKSEVLGKEMLIISIIGLFFNFVKIMILSQDGDHSHDTNEDASLEPEGNINVDAAFLRVLSDLIVSIGVIFAAIIIYIEPSW
jgi:Co/Zn/Cd efflux system component